MANVGDLNKKLTELAALEKALWNAFINAEREYTPSPFRLIDAFKTTIRLCDADLIKWYQNYPVYIVAGALSAIATFASQLFLIPYILFLYLIFKTREKYVHAFAVDKLGTQTYTKHGFGLDNLSLVTVGIIKLRDAGEGRLTKETITSITKIVKASQDHNEVTFGLLDQLKKSMYAAPFPLLYAAFKNMDVVADYTDKTVEFLAKNPLVTSILATISLGVLFFLYDLLFSQTLMKQRKKKYLLLLTIISESFK